MKILFVLNNLYAVGNGLSASARRTVAALKEAGEEVKVLSGPNAAPDGPQPDFRLKDFHFPFFEPIIRAHGYKFASTDVKVVEEAVRWADVIHMQEPFVLEIRTAKIARRLGKPITGTYHLHPENIFHSLGLGSSYLPNHWLLTAWRDLCFNKWDLVQCPTANVLDRLQQNGFTSRLRLISNGIVPDQCIRQPQEVKAPFTICCIGRLAGEKDQMTLLRAMEYSTHAKDIRLIFAGKGPREKRFRRQADSLYKKGILSHKPEFVFLDRDGLRELAASSLLCIHCATVEVEGLSIIEALQQGAVPVIAYGPITGADQFALDERSRFAQGNAQELAQKIDFWLDHPDQMDAMRGRYIEEMQRYVIRNSAEQLIQMFQEAIHK